MISRLRLLIAALAFGAVAVTGAHAQAIEPSWLGPRLDGAVLDSVQARLLSVRQVIAIVQSQRGGQCVDVRAGPIQGDGGWFYVLRWRYPNGAEEDIRVDAVSGRVLGR